MNPARIPRQSAQAVDWLLGLEKLSWDQWGTRLGWDWPLPGWAWAAVVIIALGVSAWSYSRLAVPRPARVPLALVRALLLIFMAVLLAGPVLVFAREKVEPDTLLILVDRSESMKVRDVRATGAEGLSQTVVTRDNAMRDALTRNEAMFESVLRGPERRLAWYGFDKGLYAVPPPYERPETWPAADGPGTALRAAIENALDKSAGRPVSGVVILTDGRSPEPTGPGLIERLRKQAVSVFAVPVGAETPPFDLSIARVNAPTRSFINDAVPVSAWVRVQEGPDADAAAAVLVTLKDTVTGEVVDTQRVTTEALDAPVQLTGESGSAGLANWEVEVALESGTAATTAELATENNRRRVAVEIVGRPLRVLYVEGYPRWEYRYLKNVLLREESIECSIILASADRGFAQEGDIPIARLPSDAEEVRPYDVVMIGDVPSGYFSMAQLELIRDQVALAGAGLLWVGGAYENPHGYTATALADLLPMRHPSEVGVVNPADGPFRVTPTPAAGLLNVFALGSDHEDGPAATPTGWLDRLPGLAWVQDPGPLKPSAGVLAVADSARGTSTPVVIRMRYGTGQCLYVGTDETWRWRYGRGDLYYERFWVQLLRMLGRSRLAGSSDRASFEVSQPRVGVGEPVVVDLRVYDALLADRSRSRVAVQVVGPDQPGSRQEIHLLPAGAPGSPGTPGNPSDTGPAVYTTIWKPDTPGPHRLRVSDPLLEGLELEQTVTAVEPDDEQRDVVADYARLRALSEQTGGQLVSLNRLEELPRLIPNRARRTPDDIREPFWDSPLSLIIVMTLLTVEWVGRKLVRLV